jgi:hypothetical protein
MAVAASERRTDPAAAVILLSGAYDLAPIVGTYVNDALGLTPTIARRLSPLHRLPLRAGYVVVCRAEHETAEYARQQSQFAAAAAAAGNRVSTWVASGQNHFDLPMSLAEPTSMLTSLTRELLGTGGLSATTLQRTGTCELHMEAGHGDEGLLRADDQGQVGSGTELSW